ncbi:MAG: TM0996/MTH895 family glutaredoxin-like protein [Bacteroidales bacterium]|nr:TM0996/MTH895 family glutaredoxin-like protein [Bacteroidales bacterium]
MEIKVLGTGCPKCKSLEEATKKAVAELNLDVTVEKVEDIMKIMEFGVASTPALVVDNKVVVNGRVPSVYEIKQFLTN